MMEFSILDDNARSQIHQASLRVLKEVGYQVQDEHLIEILQDGGAQLTEGHIHLSENQIIDALESAPEQFKVGDRIGNSFVLGDNSQHFTNSILDALRFRSRDGTIRPTLLKDLVQTVRLCDALPEMEIIRAYAVPDDYRGIEREVKVIEAVLSNSAKHCWMSAASIENAKYWFEIIDILTGLGKHDFPYFSVMVCPHSPLAINKVVSHITLESAQRGLPIICSPVPLAGGTTPFTLAGTLVLSNAETLFILVCAQTIRPGLPFVYGPHTSIMDMSTGAFRSMGPERMLLGLGNTQMARWYKLPDYFTVGHSGSKLLDIQAGYEHGMGLITALSSRASVVGCVGSLTQAIVLSPEDTLIGIEFIRALKRLRDGILINPETIAYDTIKDVGPGGHFLTAEHTLRHLRGKERFNSRLFDHADIKTPSQSMLERAALVMDEILAEHQSNVPQDQIKAIESFVRDRTR